MAWADENVIDVPDHFYGGEPTIPRWKYDELFKNLFDRVLELEDQVRRIKTEAGLIITKPKLP